MGFAYEEADDSAYFVPLLEWGHKHFLKRALNLNPNFHSLSGLTFLLTVYFTRVKLSDRVSI